MNSGENIKKRSGKRWWARIHGDFSDLVQRVVSQRYPGILVGPKEHTAVFEEIFSVRPEDMEKFLEIVSEMRRPDQYRFTVVLPYEYKTKVMSEKPPDIEAWVWTTSWFLAWVYHHYPNMLPDWVKKRLQVTVGPPSSTDIYKACRRAFHSTLLPAEEVIDVPIKKAVLYLEHLLPATVHGKIDFRKPFDFFARSRDPLHLAYILHTTAAFIASAPLLPQNVRSHPVFSKYEDLIEQLNNDEITLTEAYYHVLSRHISTLIGAEDPDHSTLYTSLRKLWETHARHYVLTLLTPRDPLSYEEMSTKTFTKKMDHVIFLSKDLNPRTFYTVVEPILVYRGSDTYKIVNGIPVFVREPYVQIILNTPEPPIIHLSNDLQAIILSKLLNYPVLSLVTVDEKEKKGKEGEQMMAVVYRALATTSTSTIKNPIEREILSRGYREWLRALAIAGMGDPDDDEPDWNTLMDWTVRDLERFLNNLGRLFSPGYISIPPDGPVGFDSYYAQIYALISVLSVTRFTSWRTKDIHNFHVLLYGLHGLGKSELISEIRRVLGEDRFYNISPTTTEKALIGGVVDHIGPGGKKQKIFRVGEIYRYDGGVVSIPELDKVSSTSKGLIRELAQQMSEKTVQYRQALAQYIAKPDHPPNFSVLSAANPAEQGLDEMMLRYAAVLTEMSEKDIHSLLRQVGESGISVAQIVRKHFKDPATLALLDRIDRIVPVYTPITHQRIREWIRGYIGHTYIGFIGDDRARTYRVEPTGEATIFEYSLDTPKLMFEYLRTVSVDTAKPIVVADGGEKKEIDPVTLVLERIEKVQNRVKAWARERIGLDEKNLPEDKDLLLSMAKNYGLIVNPRRINTMKKIAFTLAKIFGLLDPKAFREVYTEGTVEVGGKRLPRLNRRLLNKVLDLIEEFVANEAMVWWAMYTSEGQVRYPVPLERFQEILIEATAESGVLDIDRGTLTVSLSDLVRTITNKMSVYSGVEIGGREYPFNPKDFMGQFAEMAEKKYMKYVQAGYLEIQQLENDYRITFFAANQEDLRNLYRWSVKAKKDRLVYTLEVAT